MSIILVITGSRTFTNTDVIEGALNDVHNDRGIKVMFSGSASSGADVICQDWARNRGVQLVEVPEPWRIGREAGFIRNKFMVSLALAYAEVEGYAIRGLAFANICKDSKCLRRNKGEQPHYTHGTENCIQVFNDTKIGIRAKIITAVQP